MSLLVVWYGCFTACFGLCLRWLCRPYLRCSRTRKKPFRFFFNNNIGQYENVAPTLYMLLLLLQLPPQNAGHEKLCCSLPRCCASVGVRSTLALTTAVPQQQTPHAHTYLRR
ncbi:unnamed protein product, partial [Laminaria digitata]